MLAAYAWFIWVCLHALTSVMHSGHELRRSAATAALIGILSLSVLMVFDPHLTMRGSSDLLFALLALGLTHCSCHNATSRLRNPGSPKRAPLDVP